MHNYNAPIFKKWGKREAKGNIYLDEYSKSYYQNFDHNYDNGVLP